MTDFEPTVPGSKNPRIVLLSGSSRPESHTAVLAEFLAAHLQQRGALVAHWDLVTRDLPPPDPIFHGSPSRHPDPRVRDLVEFVDRADGIVLACPVYHNSYSATLKVALDHLSIAQFWYKPVSLLSHGERRNTQAVDHLRLVVRGLLGLALPAQVCTADEDYEAQNGMLTLCEPTTIKRVERVAAEMVLFARYLRLLRESLA